MKITYKILPLPLFLLLISICLGSLLHAQESYWVYFIDKGPQAAQRLAEKKVALSSAALDRRHGQGIALTSSDLPIYPPYIQNVQNEHLPILATSRWFNALVVSASQEEIAELLKNPIISAAAPVRSYLVRPSKVEYLGEEDIDYGVADRQIRMLGLDRLHEKGFTGKGVRIAIFDGGFKESQHHKALANLWETNKVLAAYDFVRDQMDLSLSSSSHGTQVWSTIGAQIEGKLVGAAFDADFILGVTELPATETRAEEYHWINAMEWADSIGVDIIHSSLSYSEFDTQEDSYRFQDMDGNTTLVTRAADRAASKGIIVTTGAGNEGNDPWRRITAPCDGDSVLCVGAVDERGEIAYFSSVGPSADGQVKPDVVAMGQNTALATPGNTIRLGSGTSYSSPIVAGMAACLRQAHPKRHGADIVQAIRLSSDRFTQPDSLYGYGIPNAPLADSLLRFVEDLYSFSFPLPIQEEPDSLELSPLDFFTENPKSTFRIIADNLSVITVDTEIVETRIRFGEDQVFFPESAHQQSPNRVVYDLSYLLPGPYHIEIKTSEYEEWIKFSRK